MNPRKRTRHPAYRTNTTRLTWESCKEYYSTSGKTINYISSEVRRQRGTKTCACGMENQRTKHQAKHSIRRITKQTTHCTPSQIHRTLFRPWMFPQGYEELFGWNRSHLVQAISIDNIVKNVNRWMGWYYAKDHWKSRRQHPIHLESLRVTVQRTRLWSILICQLMRSTVQTTNA